MAIGQLQLVVDRPVQRQIARSINDLALARFGHRAPELVGIALLAQPGQARRGQCLRKTQRDIGKPPKYGLLLFIIQENRQTPYQPGAALRQRQGPGQRQLAGVARQNGFLVLPRVFQLVETKAFFIARQRNHLTDDPTRRKGQGRNAGIEREHFGGDRFKTRYLPMPLPNERSNGIGGRQGPLDAALQGLGMV